MQDDLLMDKAQPRQQQQPQHLPSASPQDPASEAPCASDPPSPDNIGLKEKMQLQSPLLPGLSFPPGHDPPSLSPWSTGSGGAEDSFFQGGPTPVNGTLLFQNFSHHHHHHHQQQPVFGGPFSPQLGPGPHHHHQQHRRSPVSQRNQYGHQAILTTKPSSSSSSSWNNQQNPTWNGPSNPWGALHSQRDPRRAVGVGVGVGVGVPSPLNPISPMKKPFSSNVIAPPKFPRASPLGPKSWVEDNIFRTENGNTLLPLQDRNRPYDSFNLHSLENSLMDMIRTDQEPLKGKLFATKEYIEGLLPENYGHINKPGTPRKLELELG